MRALSLVSTLSVKVLIVIQTKKNPNFKGFTCKTSKHRFHGIAVYICNHLKGHALRVPDEDDGIKKVHLIIKNTTPVCNVFACYLDVESTGTTDDTSKV